MLVMVMHMIMVVVVMNNFLPGITDMFCIIEKYSSHSGKLSKNYPTLIGKAPRGWSSCKGSCPVRWINCPRRSLNAVRKYSYLMQVDILL